MCNTYTHDVFRLQRHVTFAVIYEIKFCMQTVCYSKESNGSLYIYIYTAAQDVLYACREALSADLVLKSCFGLLKFKDAMICLGHTKRNSSSVEKCTAI